MLKLLAALMSAAQIYGQDPLHPQKCDYSRLTIVNLE